MTVQEEEEEMTVHEGSRRNNAKCKAQEGVINVSG